MHSIRLYADSNAYYIQNCYLLLIAMRVAFKQTILLITMCVIFNQAIYCLEQCMLHSIKLSTADTNACCIQSSYLLLIAILVVFNKLCC